MSVIAYGQGKPLSERSRDTLPIKFDSLKAAIVTATMRPHLRGDTLEYNTEHVLMRPNAMVEELLRRLPGLHIGADGTITYNGENIQRLLVDGEDIFGDDPTMVTRNFDADKIARVQILDRKTDKAIFTGMEDATRVKTLNLVMKESAKNGYFGRVEAGGSADSYYSVAGALAGFRDKEQFTALGLAGNMGVTGFSGGGGSSPARIGFLYSMDDPLGASAGAGIPRFTATGLHYANRWQGMDDHLLANYQFGHSWTHPVTQTQTLQIEPGSVFGQIQNSQSINQQFQHAIRGMYECAIGPKSALLCDYHSNFYHYKNQFDVTASSSFNDTLVNNSSRNIRDQTDRQNIGGDVSWRTRLGKQSERVFSFSAGITKIDYTTNGYLYSLNSYYRSNGSLLSIDTVDQRKVLADHNLTLTSGMTFSQPLLPGTTLGFSYNLSLVNDNPSQFTYARREGKYDQTIDSLTSDLNTRTITHRARMVINGKSRHLNYTIGVDWLDYAYHQQDRLTDSIFRLHYINWIPKIMVNYVPKSTFNIKFNYDAVTEQPSIAQLAPIRNNNDPLHLTMGNPDLRPSTSQNFRLNFQSLKAWMIGLSLNLVIRKNYISTRTITDSLGRQISQSLNVNGGGVAGFGIYLNHRLGGIDWSLHTANTLSRTVAYVNADLSSNEVYTTGGGLGATKNVADKYSFQLTTGFSYLYSHNSINTAATLHYWTQSHSGMATFYLVPHYEFGTSATYTWQEKASVFSENTSVLLWNVYVSRNFIHDKLVMKLLLNNILNEDAGINRTNNGNINTQTATNILGRYWMLNVSYHFDKKFKRR